jgi:galactokinase
MTAAAAHAFVEAFGASPARRIYAPGRVNLIGEHIDYAGLPVLPMAIDRGITLHIRPRADGCIRLVNAGPAFGEREFAIAGSISPYAAGDWGNYSKAAIQGLVSAGYEPAGFDALVSSNLPPAAGLSSSSALVVGTALAALAAAGRSLPTDTLPLASLLARAEHYVGAHGGGMDQAAILAGRSGHAMHIEFDPLRVRRVRVPRDWRFVVAHSLASAEKSGAAREAYNTRRDEVERALEVVGVASGGYRSLLARLDSGERDLLDDSLLPAPLGRRFRHVVSETHRVARAEEAMHMGDAVGFGGLMLASHESLRTDFEVSTPALDALVEASLSAGAVGARLTGAGLGGCVLALVPAGILDGFLQRLHAAFYEPREMRPRGSHLFSVTPAAGATIGSA